MSDYGDTDLPAPQSAHELAATATTTTQRRKIPRPAVFKLLRIDCLDRLAWYLKLYMASGAVMIITLVFIFIFISAWRSEDHFHHQETQQQYQLLLSGVASLIGLFCTVLGIFHIITEQRHIPLQPLYQRIVMFTEDEIYYDHKCKGYHVTLLRSIHLFHRYNEVLIYWTIFNIIWLTFQVIAVPLLVLITSGEEIRVLSEQMIQNTTTTTDTLLDAALTELTNDNITQQSHFSRMLNVLTLKKHILIWFVANSFYAFFTLCYYLPDYIFTTKHKPRGVQTRYNPVLLKKMGLQANVTKRKLD